jgi:hypothetical protein
VSELTLGEKQELFATELLPDLLSYIRFKGYRVRMGAVERTITEQQHMIANGKSGIKMRDAAKGAHVRRLAVDLHLFKDGLYLDRTEDHELIGKWWERRHELCRWGGRFGDGNHYSLEHEGFK